jgi:ectoine hydroxylase-related dioxygenase (phytanoyl-CoA dioxygenase family)
VSKDASTRIAQEVVSEGYAILRDVIPPDLVEALRDVALGCMAELGVPFGPNVFLGERTRRLFNLLARDRVFEAVPVHEAVLPVVEGVLDAELLLSSLTAIEMHPGETAQPLHADDGSIGLPRPHPPITCSALWALTDFREENGATRIVPGSHLADRRPRKGEQAECVQAEMSSGSVLIYHGSLWHGGGENRSSAPRMGIVSNYCAGFLRQEECQLLALPRKRVAKFEPRLRKLVGYGTYRGLMGHVDQRDPATLLDPDTPTEMVWERMR